MNEQAPPASVAAVTNSAATSPALPDVIEVAGGMTRLSAGTWSAASPAPVDAGRRHSGPMPKDAVQLKTGGWADLSTVILCIAGDDCSHRSDQGKAQLMALHQAR